MRHHNKNKKFGLKTTERKALLRSLTRSLFLKESITTTATRAKALRPIAEKLVTRAKNPTLANHRVLLSRTYGDERLVKKIESIAAEQKERAGGYLRVVKLPARKSDGSAMAVIQFVKE